MNTAHRTLIHDRRWQSKDVQVQSHRTLIHACELYEDWPMAGVGNGNAPRSSVCNAVAR